MTATREAAFRIYVATTGSRKTTDIKELLTEKRPRNLVVPSGRDDKAWHQFEPLKWEVIQAPDVWRPGKMTPKVVVPELNTFTGIRVLHVDGQQRIFDALIDPVTGIQDARVVLDDFRNYVFSNGQLRHEVATFFKNRRHKMLDLFLACHSMEDVSREILALNPKIIVGLTTTMPTDTTMAKVRNGQILLETMRRVNSINLARPEGERFYKEAVQM